MRRSSGLERKFAGYPVAETKSPQYGFITLGQGADQVDRLRPESQIQVRSRRKGGRRRVRVVDGDDLFIVCREFTKFEINQLLGIDFVESIAGSDVARLVMTERYAFPAGQHAAALAGRLAQCVGDDGRAKWRG